MSDHDCPGLAECVTHPRWHVVKLWGMWYVIGLRTMPRARYATHAEAMEYADREARRD